MDRELSIKTISLVASQRNATILEKHIFEKSDSNDDKYKCYFKIKRLRKLTMRLKMEE